MSDLSDNIESVIVLMFENRSFDHLIGSQSLPSGGGRKDIDGLTSETNPDYANPFDGKKYFPFDLGSSLFNKDMPHERHRVTTQLATNPGGSPTMRGFARAYFEENPNNQPDKPPSMGYHTEKRAPVTHFLAREYMVCDRYFASLPTSTQPNRLMFYSGFTKEDTTGGFLANQDMTLDWAEARGKTWRSYHLGVSYFFLMPRLIPKIGVDGLFRSFERFEADLNDTTVPFPQIVYLEPAYDDAAIFNQGIPSCDNHPPVAMEPGEAFLRRVYEIVRRSKRWNKVALIVTYDEHGGFFDHVIPPPCRTEPPPGEHYAPFATLGVRVPTLVVSPHVAPGSVFGTDAGGPHLLDHTSLLQFFADCFDDGKPYSPEVAKREMLAGLSRLADGLAFNARTTDPPPAPAVASAAPKVLTALKKTAVAPPSPGEDAFLAAAKNVVRQLGPDAEQLVPGVTATVRARDAATTSVLAGARVAARTAASPRSASRKRKPASPKKSTRRAAKKRG